MTKSLDKAIEAVEAMITDYYNNNKLNAMRFGSNALEQLKALRHLEMIRKK